MNTVMRTPRSFDVEVTSRCNLRCRYCYYFDNDGVGYRDLPTEEWLRFFDELGRAGTMDVTLCGGEPFIRADLPQLIDGIVANAMRFSVLSNGSLVTGELAARIAATGRCDAVQVSVDGPSADVHDTLRGRGSFDGAVRGIRTLQDHGVPVTSRLTIHRRNIDHVEGTVAFLLEELGLPAISTSSAGSLGSCQRHEEEVLLTARERERAMRALLRLEARYPGRISATAGPLAEARMWRRMEEARRDGTAIPGRGRLTGCGCTMNKLAVRADGAYVPCIMLASLEIGRINTDPLEEVWRHSPVLERMRGRAETPLSVFRECDGCGYLALCTGNCPSLPYSLTGELDRPSPEGCLRRYLREGGRLPEEREVPA